MEWNMFVPFGCILLYFVGLAMLVFGLGTGVSYARANRASSMFIAHTLAAVGSALCGMSFRLGRGSIPSRLVSFSGWVEWFYYSVAVLLLLMLAVDLTLRLIGKGGISTEVRAR
jgi:hypothetical protein